MRKLLSDTVFTGFSHFIAAVAQIGLQIYVVRATYPKAFGEYTVALAVEAMVEAIFLARSGELALQYVGKHWVVGDYATAYSCVRRMVRLDWIINWSLYAVLAVLAFALSNLLHINPRYLLGLALMIPAQIGYGVYKGIFITAHKLKQQAMFESCFTISQLLLGVLGVYLFAIPGLIGALVLSALAKTVLAKEITRRWWPEGVEKDRASVSAQDPEGMESWLSFGLHSILRNALASGANQVDILILNAVQGAEPVAIYKVAKTLSALPVRAAGPLWSALRPRIMRAWHHRDKEQMKRLVVLPSLLMLGALVLSLPLVWYFAGDLILMLYGKAYVEASLPFMLLLVGSWTFSAMTAWFVFWVIISEARMSGTIVYGILFITTLGGGMLWGARSVQAMSLVVSASMVIASIVCWLIFTRTLKIMSKSELHSNHLTGLEIE